MASLSFLALKRRLLQLENDASHAAVVFERFIAFRGSTEVAKLRDSLPFGARLDVISFSDVFFFGISKILNSLRS